MDNLKNMMAEMEKMQKQMQEIAEKQAADAAKEENKPAVSIADLDSVARKLGQAEEAAAELHTITEKITSLENVIQEAVDAVTDLKMMLMEGRADTAVEENTIVEDLQEEFVKIIEKNTYPYATKDYNDANGTRVFFLLEKTIRSFAEEMKKYAHYNKQLSFLEEVIKFTETLYRSIYVSRIMEYGLYCGNWSKNGEICDNRQYPANLPCDQYIDSAYIFGKGSGYGDETAAAINAVRQDHLTSMQNEAMEKILAEVAKYI